MAPAGLFLLRPLRSKTNGILFLIRTHSTVTAVQTKPATEAFDFENAKSFDEIPAIPSYPVIKSAWQYLPVIGKYSMRKWAAANLDKYRTYGKIVKEVAPMGRNVVHLYDPADIETLFRFEGKMPTRIGLEPLVHYRKMRKEHFGSGGLVCTQGQDWYDFRMKVQPHMMRIKTIRSYLPHMNVVASDMIKMIDSLRDEEGEISDMMNELYKWALESIAVVAMDTRLGCLDPHLPEDSEPRKLIQAANFTFQAMGDLMIKPPLYMYISTPQWKKFVETMDFFTNTANKYINQAIERMKTTKVEDRELTILESLLNVDNFSKVDALTMVGDMLVAGIDTSSTAIGFTLYEIAKNPEQQQKAYEEICKVVPSKDDPVTLDVLNRIPYIQSCFREALRLHPVTDGTVRTLQRDVVVSGYHVPAGTMMMAHIAVVGRLPEYFSEPLKYKPERWMKETKEIFHPFSALPFGFGPRMCIGRRIAEQEILVLLIKILQNFKLEYRHEDIDVRSRLINIPDGPLRIAFVPRV